MSGKVKASLLAAAIVAAGAASQAQASFTYDLRFAQGQGQTDAHTVTNPVAGNYTLQLWGQITGDTDPTNDIFTSGYITIKSNQVSSAFTSGGVTSSALGSNVGGAGSNLGTQGNVTADGISDWGSASTTSTAGWLAWVSSAPTALSGIFGFTPAGQTSQSEAVNPNTWEVLLASYVVNVGGVAAADSTDHVTQFQIGFSQSGNKQGTTTNKSVVWFQDGSNVAHNNTTDTPTIGAGVSFVVPGAAAIPEPASLGILALGAMGLLARRRK